MIAWIAFSVTFASHILLIVMYERQRRHLDNVREALKRHQKTIRRMESQLRIASRQLFK